MAGHRRDFLRASLVTASALAADGAEADPLGVRHDFPAANETTFLNTAYIGLTPQPVADAAREWTEARLRRPYRVEQMEAKKRETRQLFAQMVGATTDEIAFLTSTTEGENLVVNSLDFKAGDNVVFDDLVYPSTAVIYRRLQETHGVEMRVVASRNGIASIADFEKLVDKRTRIISVAWISNVNGYRHDIRSLADLAHAHGAYLYADAAQFIGTGPVDIHALGVDFCTTGTYKWLMAGFGLAPFYVRQDLLEKLHAPNVGWMVKQSLPGYRYEAHTNARKFEYASPAYGEFFSLATALTYLQKVGLDKIEHQTTSLAAALRDGLAGQGFNLLTPVENRAPIVSFLVKRPQKELAGILEAGGVTVSLHEENAGTTRVRVAPAFFNHAGDIRRFLDVARKMA